MEKSIYDNKQEYKISQSKQIIRNIQGLCEDIRCLLRYSKEDCSKCKDIS